MRSVGLSRLHSSCPLRFLTLYQQVLYEVMKEEIIKSGSWDDATKKRLNDAADKWRLPFWDWAAKRPDTKTGTYKVPHIAYGTTVKVFRPDGQSETPQNPMYSYGPGGAFKDFGVNLNSDREHKDNAVRLTSCSLVKTIAKFSRVWYQQGYQQMGQVNCR
jgi:hypothetical protein